MRLNDHAAHATRPAHGVPPRKQHRKVTAHGAVHGGCFTVRLHQRRVERDVFRYSLQLRDGHAHHEGDRARAVDGDDRLGENTTGIFDKRTALRQGNGRDISQVPEGLASEVDRKGQMRIAAEDLLKGNLVDDARLVICLLYTSPSPRD